MNLQDHILLWNKALIEIIDIRQSSFCPSFRLMHSSITSLNVSLKRQKQTKYHIQKRADPFTRDQLFGYIMSLFCYVDIAPVT